MGNLQGPAEVRLHEVWLQLRDDASRLMTEYMVGAINMAFTLGALSEDGVELWLYRMKQCPGHADEGGRSWCAYCGEMRKEPSND